MNRTLDEILDYLGGDSAVAARLGCGQPAISNWKSRGVPKARWVDLSYMAKSLDLELTIDEIRQASDAAVEAKAVA